MTRIDLQVNNIGAVGLGMTIAVQAGPLLLQPLKFMQQNGKYWQKVTRIDLQVYNIWALGIRMTIAVQAGPFFLQPLFRTDLADNTYVVYLTYTETNMSMLDFDLNNSVKLPMDLNMVHIHFHNSLCKHCSSL